MKTKYRILRWIYSVKESDLFFVKIRLAILMLRPCKHEFYIGNCAFSQKCAFCGKIKMYDQSPVRMEWK